LYHNQLQEKHHKYRHTICRFAICLAYLCVLAFAWCCESCTETWTGGDARSCIWLNLQHPTTHIILQLKEVRDVCYNHLACEESNLHMDYSLICASDLHLGLQDVVSEYKLYYCNAKLFFGTWVFKMCKKNESRNKVACRLVSITHAYLKGESYYFYKVIVLDSCHHCNDNPIVRKLSHSVQKWENKHCYAFICLHTVDKCNKDWK